MLKLPFLFVLQQWQTKINSIASEWLWLLQMKYKKKKKKKKKKKEQTDQRGASMFHTINKEEIQEQRNGSFVS